MCHEALKESVCLRMGGSRFCACHSRLCTLLKRWVGVASDNSCAHERDEAEDALGLVGVCERRDGAREAGADRTVTREAVQKRIQIGPLGELIGFTSQERLGETSQGTGLL
jgi:hypothetical protein